MNILIKGLGVISVLFALGILRSLSDMCAGAQDCITQVGLIGVVLLILGAYNVIKG